MSRSISKKARFGIISGAAVAALLLTPVVASGAYFSASDTGSVEVSTATLSLSLSDNNDVGTFDLDFDNLAPGQTTPAQNIKIRNTGTIAATAKIGGDTAWGLNGLSATDKTMLKVSVNGATPFPVSQLPASVNLGTLAAGHATTVSIAFSLDAAAGNSWQGKTIGTTGTVTLDQLH